MSLSVINGDILKVVEHGDIIHQVNCRHIAGAGLARQIRFKYPLWYERYKAHPNPQLGKIGVTSVDMGLYIVDFYAQFDVGTQKRRTDYDAFESCLISYADAYSNGGSTAFFPYGIGCGLGGGDWDIISNLIETWLPYATIVRMR